MKKNVAVILVTFNRLELLKESIEKLVDQTAEISKIFIINNNSNDGTKEYLSKYDDDSLFTIVNLKNNVGGAGGFSYGLKYAHDNGNFDFYWIMDDDTLPENNALEELLKTNKGDSVLASNVLWRDTDEPAIMNIPEPAGNWTYGCLEGLNEIKSTSFVSMFISNHALETCGLPIKEFFIWGDDVEFSRRIINKFGGYFVAKSIARHKTKDNTTVDILNESNPNRVGRYFYAIRNKLYMDKQDGMKSVIKNELSYFLLISKLLFGSYPYKFKKLKVLIKGHLYGLFFNPKVEKLN